MTKDFSKRGPCCDYYEKRQREFRAKLKVFYVFLDGTPRLWMMLYEQLVAGGTSPEAISLFLDDKPCPCCEAPDPVLFRKFVAVPKPQVDANKDMLSIDQIDDIATKFFKDEGLV